MVKYPGLEEAEQARVSPPAEEEPDFVMGAPNYDKFPDWTPEEVLIWLNID